MEDSAGVRSYMGRAPVSFKEILQLSRAGHVCTGFTALPGSCEMLKERDKLC